MYINALDFFLNVVLVLKVSGDPKQMTLVSGIPFGTTVTLAASGLLSNTRIGWPAVFYVSGFIGIVWAVIWSIFGSNSPTECGVISMAEYSYIRDHVPSTSTENKVTLYCICM